MNVQPGPATNGPATNGPATNGPAANGAATASAAVATADHVQPHCGRDRRRNADRASFWPNPLSQSFAKFANRLSGWGAPWSFRRRRWVSLFLTLLVWILTYQLVVWADAVLLRPSLLTGWTLMGCLVMLIAIGVRRRLPILPLGSVSVWTQIHIYTGLFAAGVFLLHTPRGWAAVASMWTDFGTSDFVAPGWLEGTLATLFLGVTASGIYGWIASRRVPARLTVIGGEVRFDQIGWHRQQVAETAAERIGSLQGQAAVTVLGDFYGSSLKPYFRTRPSWWYLAFPNSARRRRLLTRLTHLDRYLETEGRRVAGQLAGLVRRRDDLDYQYALQWRLRAWVVVHATMSLALVILAMLHGILATRFVQS